MLRYQISVRLGGYFCIHGFQMVCVQKVVFLNVYLKKKKAPGVARSNAFATVTSLPSL